ncbi:export ABC transporter ATP-binding protein [Candidatus Saccharibacteria bacterium]|nr:MAG: export ABC transporter ATP-binding protein [Candidatus Saccharibacteria bacterium]
MIQVTGVTKTFRRKVAVSDMSFAVASGKVTGFLGPNGAGKSTTMRIMAGLDHGEGQVLYDDKPLLAHPRPSNVVGILLEAKAFHPTRRARDHLRVLAAQGGVSESRVDEVLDMVGLHDVAKKRPGKFSLGMSQRLGIAAAILGRPSHLILDEPANGLDPEGIAWLRRFIKDYADQGNAVFVSSHLLSEMSQMADDVVVIGKGKIIANTTINELLQSKGSAETVVRTAQLDKLAEALRQEKYDFQQQGEQIIVRGQISDTIGEVAFRANIPLLELSSRSASLEDVFLQLTESAEEFTSGAGGTKQ